MTPKSQFPRYHPRCNADAFLRELQHYAEDHEGWAAGKAVEDFSRDIRRSAGDRDSEVRELREQVAELEDVIFKNQNLPSSEDSARPDEDLECATT